MLQSGYKEFLILCEYMYQRRQQGVKRDERASGPDLINLPIGCQVQIWAVEQSVHAFQGQSFAASFAKKPQDGVGCSHLASFPSFGFGDTYPATLCQGVALAPFQGLLLCLLDGRPFSDSYEGSVALSVATRRPSRLYA